MIANTIYDRELLKNGEPFNHNLFECRSFSNDVKEQNLPTLYSASDIPYIDEKAGDLTTGDHVSDTFHVDDKRPNLQQIDMVPNPPFIVDQMVNLKEGQDPDRPFLEYKPKMLTKDVSTKGPLYDGAKEVNQTKEIPVPNSLKYDNNTRKFPKGVSAPDGGWGWMVVVGSFFTYFIASGLVYSFGIIYIEFLDFYKGGKAETAWVGSLIMGMMLLVGPLASASINKFGSRVTTCIGACLAAAGFVLSIFSPHLYFLYFTFGTLSGLGFGLIYLPSIVIVGQYFEKRRSLALGLSMSGMGFGIFVFSPVSKYLIDEYGWKGALLIEAGFILNCAVCGALFRPLNVSELSSLNGSVQSLMSSRNNTKHSNEVLAAATETRGDIELADHYLPQENANQEQSELLLENLYDKDGTCKDKRVPAHDNTFVTPLPVEDKKCSLNSYLVRVFKSFKQTFDFSLLKNNIFLIYVISNVLTSMAIGAPFIFLADRALDAGISLESSKWILAARGITTTVGKVIVGYMSDFKGVNRLYFYISILISLGVSTASCPLCDSFPLLMLFGCALGLFLGGYLALYSVVLIDLVGEKMMTNGLGICLMFKGIAIFVGPPFAGWFYDITGSYDASYIFSGVILAISGVVLFPITFILRKGKCLNKI